MRGAPSPEAGWCGEAVAEHRPDAIARSACGVRRRTVEAGVAGTRGARCGVRRRRSLWLAGGCSRGAGATPGRCADGIVARRASLAGGTSPPGKGVWVPSFPGVGGAPRHRPPANKRERLRRTICAPRNGLAGNISLCAHVGLHRWRHSCGMPSGHVRLPPHHTTRPTTGGASPLPFRGGSG